MNRRNTAVVAILAWLLPSLGVEASTLMEVAALFPPEPTARFGRSVFIQDSTIVVGGLGTVDVYLRRAARWEWFQRLVDSENGNVGFGSCAKLDGNRLAVGNPTDDGGQVVIFQRLDFEDSWVEVTRLNAGSGEDRYGLHLALDRNTLMVAFGGRLLNHPAYIARYELVADNWLRHPDLQPADSLGPFTSLDLDSGVLAAGSPFDNDDDGAVQVFQLNGSSWRFAAELQSETPHRALGLSVGLEGDLIAAGAPHEDTGPTSDVNGAAYLFRRVDGDWLLGERIVDPQSGPVGSLGLFGHSIALENGWLLVGSPADGVCAGDCSTRSAKLMLFASDGLSWNLVDGFGGYELPDPDDFDGNLGQLAISGSTVVSGGTPAGWFLGPDVVPRVYEIVPSILEVPTLDWRALAAMASGLAALSLMWLRSTRRS